MTQPASPSVEFFDLVSATRERCLWYFRADDLPTERERQLDTLTLIERYGTRNDYVRARQLKQWLQRNSSAAFSVS